MLKPSAFGRPSEQGRHRSSESECSTVPTRLRNGIPQIQQISTGNLGRHHCAHCGQIAHVGDVLALGAPCELLPLWGALPCSDQIGNGVTGAMTGLRLIRRVMFLLPASVFQLIPNDATGLARGFFGHQRDSPCGDSWRLCRHQRRRQGPGGPSAATVGLASSPAPGCGAGGPSGGGRPHAR